MENGFSEKDNEIVEGGIVETEGITSPLLEEVSPGPPDESPDGATDPDGVPAVHAGLNASFKTRRSFSKCS